jgi:hypothetical protein
MGARGVEETRRKKVVSPMDFLKWVADNCLKALKLSGGGKNGNRHGRHPIPA